MENAGLQNGMTSEKRFLRNTHVNVAREFLPDNFAREFSCVILSTRATFCWNKNSDMSENAFHQCCLPFTILETSKGISFGVHSYRFDFFW